LTGEKLNGYLDRLRENVDVLDETITNARVMGKSKKKGDTHLAQIMRQDHVKPAEPSTSYIDAGLWDTFVC